MSKIKTSINFNPGWLGLLGVIFVLLKVFAITMVATWSWWLVLLPFYLGLAILGCIIGGAAAIGVLVFAGAYILDLIEKAYRSVRRWF